MGRLSDQFYRYSLHQEKEDPEMGYGYNGLSYPVSYKYSIETIQAIADYFNRNQIWYKPENGKFVVTDLTSKNS